MYTESFAKTFAFFFKENSTFNFPHSLSLHTKGHRIVHSRQGPLVKSRYILGMVIPPLIGILIMGPYKPLQVRNWVDFPIPYYIWKCHGSWSTLALQASKFSDHVRPWGLRTDHGCLRKRWPLMIEWRCLIRKKNHVSTYFDCSLDISISSYWWREKTPI